MRKIKDRATGEKKCRRCGRWYTPGESEFSSHLVSSREYFCPECAKNISKYRDAKIEGEI